MSVQLTISFDPIVARRYTSLEDVTRDAYGTSARVKREIAADCDLAPSALAAMVYGNGERKLGIADFERLLDAMPDTRGMVLDYLISRYLDRDAERQARAADLILQLGPVLMAAAEALHPGRKV